MHCRKMVGAGGLLLVALAGSLTGCGKSPPPSAPGAPHGPFSVTVLTVTPTDVPVATEFVAQTQSSRQVSIQARVSGFLDRRVYTEGSMVKAGDVLFLLDRKPFQAQLDQSKAALQQQQAALETTSSNLDRTKPLVEQDALSQKDLDDARGQFNQASAAVAQAKAQVVQAQLNLSYTTITSPVDGIASAAAQADGTFIGTSNSQLTTVSVLSPMWVNFSVSENQYQNFRTQIEKGILRPPPGSKFEVEVALVDGSIHPAKGSITYLEPEYDTKTGTFLIRAAIDNPAGTLRPNQFVRARLHGAVRVNAIVVPQRAVQQGPKGHFVWVADKNDKAESRPVTVGIWHGDGWFIDEGLRAGDRVIVDGQMMLMPGAALKVGAPVASPGEKTPPAGSGTSAPATGGASGTSVPPPGGASAS